MLTTTPIFTSSIIIAQTAQYEIKISRAKNRVYLRMFAWWRNAEQLAHYLQDWRRAMVALSPGFTLLADIREINIQPNGVQKLQEEAQLLLLKAGIKKVAELQGPSTIKLQCEASSGPLNLPIKNFKDVCEAEAWLDQ